MKLEEGRRRGKKILLQGRHEKAKYLMKLGERDLQYYVLTATSVGTSLAGQANFTRTCPPRHSKSIGTSCAQGRLGLLGQVACAQACAIPKWFLF